MTREMDPEAMVDEAHFMQMDGQAVQVRGQAGAGEVIREVQGAIIWRLRTLITTLSIRPTSGSLNLWQSGWEPVEKFPMNLQEYNTSSASIPILLDELNGPGTLKSGQRLVLGFGAGLTWGANIIDWR